MVLNILNIAAQEQLESLYNPFEIEEPVQLFGLPGCGNGQPITLSIEEISQAFKNAFADSGINFQENIWFEKENIGMYLNGYSAKDNIGFVIINYDNVDGSFFEKSFPDYTSEAYWKQGFMKGVDDFVFQREQHFESFIERKENYINGYYFGTSSDSEDLLANFKANLKALEAIPESKMSFHNNLLEFYLDDIRISIHKYNTSASDVMMYLEDRLENSIDKLVILRLSAAFNAYDNDQDPICKKAKEEFEKLKGIKDDQQFIEKFLKLVSFLQYDNGIYSLRRDKAYLQIKSEIMDAYPLDSWFDNTKKLDQFVDRNYISLEELLLLNEHNNRGTMFIAPIYLNNKNLIIPNSAIENRMTLPEDLNNEYQKENAIYQDLIRQTSFEKRALIIKASKVYELYCNEKLKNLDQAALETMQNLKTIAEKEIKDEQNKLDARSKKIKDDHNVFYNAMQRKINEHHDNQFIQSKNKVIHALEVEVKMYIKWAKSQMGG